MGYKKGEGEGGKVYGTGKGTGTVGEGKRRERGALFVANLTNAERGAQNGPKNNFHNILPLPYLFFV